jgi:HPt (histidine-containing phosphotransfer) domain-containing protein
MKKIIKVDAELRELMPAYLRGRHEDLASIHALLEAGDFDALWGIAHKLRGSGGGFGLDFLTALGERMEVSAKAADKAALTAQAAELKDFLETLEIEFVPLD